MNKVELNKYIESICKQIPIVHSFYTDDVYEVWATDDIQYGSVSFVITNSSISDNVTNWTGVIYYADRLLEDKSNRDSVQTDANNVINAIMNAISMDDDIITINYPTEVTFFEQRFVDLLAGGYASIQIGTDNSISKCGYGFVKEQEGCAGKIAELEDEIEVLEEKNDRLSDLLGTTNEALDQAQNNLTECRASNESLIESNQQLETENDRLESEIERLEESLSILPNYTSIGYDLETADSFYQYEYDAIEYAKKIQREWDPNWFNNNTKLSGDLNLVYFPFVDTSRMTTFYNMFNGCRHLRYILKLDTSNVNNMQNAFNNCNSLITIPQLDTSNVNNMFGMFQYCNSLITIPQLDTSNVTTFNYMFERCESLLSIPQLDTSSATELNYMFQYCSSLTTIPLLDTSNVKTFYSTFNNCKSLLSIPQLDTSNVTNMYGMFQYCENLTSIPQLDTSKVTNVSNMFSSCSKLESLPLLDFNSVTTISSFFGYSNINTLTDLGGFTGLKVNFDALQRCPNLTVQSLLNVFNTIADVNGLGTRTLTIGTTNLNKLTDEQKAIATAKGWTLK